MPDLSREIIRHIPFLRRYARALTGTQEQGDHYVMASLGSLLEDPTKLDSDNPLRLQLFKFFHDTFQNAAGGAPGTDGADPACLDGAVGALRHGIAVGHEGVEQGARHRLAAAPARNGTPH